MCPEQFDLSDQPAEARHKQVAERDQTLAKARECEVQLRIMADHLPAAISYVDAERRYRFVNATYETWFGHAPADVPGKPMWEVLGDSAYASIVTHVDAALAGESVTFEAPVSYAHGGTRYVRANYVPHWDTDHRNVLGFFVLVSDISAEKAAEASERRHLLELAHVARISTVDETASHLVHELSQPLSAFSAYVSVCKTLLERGDADAAARTLDEIEAPFNDMRDMIRSFRQFLRKEEGRKDLVDLAELIHRSVALVRWEAEARGATIEVQLTKDLPDVMLDKILIGQVILNLLRNALDATDAPEFHHEPITVAAVRSDEGIEIRVEDRGPGLSPESRAKLFQPFFTTKAQGVGIGLVIARRIVETHGGRLWAEDGPHGRGARFCFTIPAEPR